jgi:hypothetical protein
MDFSTGAKGFNSALLHPFMNFERTAEICTFGCMSEPQYNAAVVNQSVYDYSEQDRLELRPGLKEMKKA